MKKSVLQNGLYFGATMIVIYLLAYFIKPELNFNTTFSMLLSIGVPLFFIIRGIRQEREENEGILTFGEAFSVGFPVYAIGLFLYMIVNTGHLMVDSEYKALGEKISMESSLNAMEKMGGMFDMDEEAFERAKKEITDNPPKITVGLMFMGFIISLIFPGAVMALITAAIMKKT